MLYHISIKLQMNMSQWNGTKEVEDLTTKPDTSGRQAGPGYSDRAFHQTINFYLTGMLMLIGLITNILIIIVMRDNAFKKTPLSVYFISLAVFDTITLFLAGTVQILKYSIGVNYFTNTVLCFTCGYLLNVAQFGSSWTMVCIALERFLVVKFPLKAKQLTSKRKASIAVTSVAISSTVVNSYYFWMVDPTSTTCSWRPSFIWFGKYGQAVFLIVFYNVIPLAITCFSYVSLVVLIYAKKDIASGSNNPAKERLTITALYICLGFVVLTSPSLIYISMSRAKGWLFRPTDSSRIFDTSAIVLLNINYSTNFFINLVSNSKFRDVIRRYLGRISQVFPASSGTSSTQNT